MENITVNYNQCSFNMDVLDEIDYLEFHYQYHAMQCLLSINGILKRN